MAALWVWALWGYKVRSWATVAALLVATLVYVGIALLGLPPPWPAVRLLVIAATVALLATNQSHFLALRAQDRQFHKAYTELLTEAQAIANAIPDAPAAYPAPLREIEFRLTTLTAPDEAWDALRREALAYFRWQRHQYETVMSDDADPEDGKEKVAALRARYRQTFEQARSFWQR